MEFETFEVHVQARSFDGLGTSEAVAVATDIAREASDYVIGTLANRILGRPEVSEDGYLERARAEQALPQAERDQLSAAWHLVKLQICRELGLDPIGDVVNARRFGASWQAIADACGITRQAAHDRWAKLVQQIQQSDKWFAHSSADDAPEAI